MVRKKCKKTSRPLPNRGINFRQSALAAVTRAMRTLGTMNRADTGLFLILAINDILTHKIAETIRDQGYTHALSGLCYR